MSLNTQGTSGSQLHGLALEPSLLSLHACLLEVLPDASKNWLGQTLRKMSGTMPDNIFALHFSAACRYGTKSPLDTTNPNAQVWLAQNPDFNPLFWSVQETLRIFLLLCYKPLPKQENTASFLQNLYQSADLSEAIALQKSLALLPHPGSMLFLAGEALRSSCESIFLALAHYNPYPYLFFPEETWNQMILKTLFINASLQPIYKKEKRHNPKLAQMLMDYVRERRAAGRPHNPQLWQFVAPYLQASDLPMLTPLFTGTKSELQAAVLALHTSSLPEAQGYLAEHLGSLQPSTSLSPPVSWESIDNET